MFGAKKLLGTLVSTGLGGLTQRPDFSAPPSQASGMGGLMGALAGAGILGALTGGPSRAESGGAFTRASSGGLGRAASLAVLGTLAYKAYQSYQQGRQQAPAQAPAGAIQAAEDAVSDDEATTMIRAMIAAANADGHIDADEEARIQRVLDQAGAGDEARRLVAREIRSPASVDALVREAKSPEMASHIYAASLLGIDQHNPTNQAYLRYLAQRLGLDPGTIAALHSQLGVPSLPAS
jgi:uncharacterized membrane protein YebE (DUF533 family)